MGPCPESFSLSICSFVLGALRVRRMAYDRYWDAVDGARTFPIIAHNNWVRGHRKKLTSFRISNLWLLWHLRSQEREVRLSTIPHPDNLTRLSHALYGNGTRKLLRPGPTPQEGPVLLRSTA